MNIGFAVITDRISPIMRLSCRLPCVTSRRVDFGWLPLFAVPELCQNPICLWCRELLFEREQLPQVVDIRHIRIERMEGLEPANILRNQQVAGSIPAGGSMFSITYSRSASQLSHLSRIFVSKQRKFATSQNQQVETGSVNQ